MADEVVSLELKVNAAEGAKSVGELRSAIKDLKSAALEAGLAGNDALAKKFTAAAGAAVDKMNDLNRAVNATQDSASKLKVFVGLGSTIASGFAAAQGAAALFGSQSEDVAKTLLKVQGAVALLQGFQGLIAGIKEARIAFTILNNVIRANPFIAVATVAIAAAAALKIFTSDTKFAAESQKDLEDRINNANRELDIQNGLINSRIGLLKSQGGNEVAILNLEKQKIELKEKQRQRELKDLQNQQIALAKEKDTAEDKRKKDIDKELSDNSFRIDILISQEEIFKNELIILETNYYDNIQNQSDERKKKRDEKKEKKAEEKRKEDKKERDRIRKEALDEYKGIQDENKRRAEEAAAEEEEQFRIRGEQQKDKIKNFRDNLFALLDSSKLVTTEIIDSTGIRIKEAFDQNLINEGEYNKGVEQLTEARKQIADAELQYKMDILAQSGSLLNSLSDLAGKQTALGKALSVASTTIDTYVAAQSAYRNVLSPASKFLPDGGITLATISAGVAVASGLARLKQILSVKVPGGGGGSPSILAGAGGTSAPNLSVNAPITKINEINQPTGTPPIQRQKIYVTETDISKTQKRINSIYKKATIE